MAIAFAGSARSSMKTWQTPSRCLITGTRASCEMLSIRPLPPRGTMASMNFSRVTSSPTTARSVVSTSWIAFSGRPAAFSPVARHAAIARFDFNDSLPTSSWAAASSARFLAAVEARASSRPAARADSPMACTRAFRSADAFRSLGMSRGFTHDGSSRDAEGQLHDGRPRISGLDAFNHAIDPMGPQELAVEGRRRVLACGTAQTLHPVRRDEAAPALARGDRHYEAHVLGERPEEKWQRLALGLPRGDHAHPARRGAPLDRPPQPVALETRDVGHRFADRFQCDLALGQEERELLDLLLRLEDGGLDAIGEPLDGLDGCALALA